jgi:dTDP-4-dehydrorhamnose reductase
VKLLITGAGGMLGRDVVRVAEQVGHDVSAFAHEDLDITDAQLAERLIRSEQPEALINCAAWTDVDGAEAHLAKAVEVNGNGARNLAAAAAAVGCKIVFPSTDYVFGGSNVEPYVESDPVNPISAYGKSKLVGEGETAANNPRHFIVRASWLFGTNGKNFVDTMLGLGRTLDEVVVVKDQVGCPTYTGHLAEGLVRLVEWEDYGIYHMAGSGECSWYEFAIEIFRQAGIECQVLSTTTDMLDRPAPRPGYSVLETERDATIRLPDWHDGLAAFLAERTEAHA